MGETAESLEERFNRNDHTKDDCRASMLGEQLPDSLGETHISNVPPYTWSRRERRCIIFGIRNHDGFALELHKMSKHPIYIRALNARAIMSNRIPDMVEPQEFPYCIWHPDLASESTYRLLIARYPQMRYHVGRACAVAGYTELYLELGLLPEVAIAEEARDSGAKGRAIFDAIMANPVKYAVMNDYTRSVNLDNPRAPAFLNCDTAVRSSIGALDNPYWDITETGHVHHNIPPGGFWIHGKPDEDGNLDDWWKEDTTPESKILSSLLSSPLPTDLPNINKDLLIHMAAHSGNIDRYVRLRRPAMLPREEDCHVHGIYNHSSFAKWWSCQPEGVPNGPLSNWRIDLAVTARFIMNNDLSRITEDLPDTCLPLLIDRPTLASAETYVELARRKPYLKQLCAQICIKAGANGYDYDDALQRLEVTPTELLIFNARQSGREAPVEILRSRAEELQMDLKIFDDDREKTDEELQNDVASDSDIDYPDTPLPVRRNRRGGCHLPTNITPEYISYDEGDLFQYFPYNQADVSIIETFVAASEEALESASKHRADVRARGGPAPYRRGSRRRDWGERKFHFEK